MGQNHGYLCGDFPPIVGFFEVFTRVPTGVFDPLPYDFKINRTRTVSNSSPSSVAVKDLLDARARPTA